MKFSLFATVLALSAFACQPLPSTVAPSDRPTPTPVPVPTNSPGQGGAACQPADVTLSPGRQGAGAGTSYIAIEVVIVRNESCLWPKWPATQLRDAEGRVIAMGAKGGGEAVPIVASLQLEFGWSSWCLAPPAAPLSLAVLLPDGVVTATLPAGFGASCMNAPTAITLQVLE
jgi:hypothetical protein